MSDLRITVLIDSAELKRLIGEAVLEALSQQKTDAEAKLFTEREAALHCRVDVHVLRHARRKGKLKCSRAGRFPRYSLEQLREWMASYEK